MQLLHTLSAFFTLLESVRGVSAANNTFIVSKPGDTAIIPSWHIQSSVAATSDLSTISKPGFDISGSKWHRTTSSRATVMAGLLEAGAYNEADLFYAENMNSSVDASMFDDPWLYREEFDIKDIPDGNHFFLNTHGISSKADIYLNGNLVASSTEQVGSYGGQVYDITPHIQNGANALLIQVHPTDYSRDLAISFIDWNQAPPDHGMGVWRNVEVSQTGPVSISDGRVTTDIDFENGHRQVNSVKATVNVYVANNEGKLIEGVIDGAIEAEDGSRKIPFSQPFSLAGNEETTASITIELNDPKVWWPATWGSQPLYTLHLSAIVNEVLSDKAKPKSFGIRQITSKVNTHNDTEFRVNGHRFLVLGAGYTSDIFLRFNEDRVRKIFQYVVDMGMNTVRLEGKQEQPELYDLADRMGLMIIAGWECCDKWEAWSYNPDADGSQWQEADYITANASMLHEARMMQSHPSMLSFFIGSDSWPDDRATQIYVSSLRSMDWPNPITASASKRGYPKLLGPSGMKMDGPYAWVPPNYWYGDKLGGAFGFGSELGAGVGTPGLQTLKKFMTDAELEELWKNPDAEFYHQARTGSPFQNRTIYNNALAARYGQPSDLADYLFKAKVMDYEATRAQFDAFSARKNDDRPATGAIYWMLNGAWPNLHWQLFDYYLKPIASYFGTKTGTRMEHITYNYEQGTVYLINHSLGSKGKRGVVVDLVDAQGKTLSHIERTVETEPNSSKEVLKVEGVDKIEDIAFLRLLLHDPASNKMLSRNVYWLSAQNDELDWDGSNWYYTPVTRYADYSALSKLAPASVQGKLFSASPDQQMRTRVELENRAKVPAFFVRLVVLDKSGDEIAPVYWSDNYVTLMPGEKVELEVSFDGKAEEIVIEGEGGNVGKFTLNS